jgi:glycolate oxidase FAD binding subunit
MQPGCSGEGTRSSWQRRIWNRSRNWLSNRSADARERKAPLWRISVKASAPYRELGGEQMIEWSGALRWLAATGRADAATVRAYAAANGGHATLFRAADKTAGAFHPLPETLLLLHRRLKSHFDPHGILNPGRLYPGL